MGSRIPQNPSNLMFPNYQQARPYYPIGYAPPTMPINMGYGFAYQGQHILQQPIQPLTSPSSIAPVSTPTSSTTSNSNSTTSSTTTSSSAKTNTQYTNFTIKNLDQSRNYFTECTTKEFASNKKNVKSVAWSCDGKKLAGGSSDTTIRVWSNLEAAGRTKEIELKGHTDSVESVAWNPVQPDILASTSSDKTVRIWDTRIGKSIGLINSQVENINITWFPDGSLLSTGSKDDLINIYDVKTLKTVKNIKFQDEVNEFGWDSKGELLLLTTGLGTIEVYKYQAKTNDLKFLKIVNAHTANIYCLDFHPSKDYFAVGSADSVVSLWDLEDMYCMKTFTKQSSAIRSISFSFDGQFIASSSEDNVIDITHVDSGQSVHQISFDNLSNSIAWSPTQTLLAMAIEGKDNPKEQGIIKVFGFHS